MLHWIVAVMICWQNPTENVDNTAIPPGDLAEIRVYKEGVHVHNFDPYQADSTGRPGWKCDNFRTSEGIANYWLTAVNVRGNESSKSNTIVKEETRLSGPGSGSVLQGPSNGRIITDGDD